ncbi:response regulator transcription factor [Ferrimonas futtsuensis]|uniref:response regulator transcription factor n=1 Tax=Ferrimonas futtsuensis TaxID=364764 RepID=UPI00048206CD|nr:response regulator transcription factor [Ferrimonas futtsuensis]
MTGTGAKVRILVVDDHAIVREGLAMLIGHERDMTVCGQADGEASALQLLAERAVEIAVVDISLGDDSGLALIKRIRRSHPEVRVIAFSMHPESIYAERVVRAGGYGYVMKSEPPEVLIDAIRQVRAGKVYLSDEMTGFLLNKVVNPKEFQTEGVKNVGVLSDRELEVFQLVGKGVPTKEIAKRLDISVKTVDALRQKMRVKLGLESASELVKFAIEYVHAM